MLSIIQAAGWPIWPLLLCSVVAILPYKTFEEAVASAKANLLIEGAGHSASLHSNNQANIRLTGVELPVSRLVVNQRAATTAGGSLTNGFAPTTTLGCGSWSSTRLTFHRVFLRFYGGESAYDV